MTLATITTGINSGWPPKWWLCQDAPTTIEIEGFTSMVGEMARVGCFMPDVGLLTFTEPLPTDARVIIKYSVEVNGLPVYTETYDVKKIERELKEDANAVKTNWLRRIQCAVCCRKRHGFSACLTRCLADGQCCKKGHEDCKKA